MSDAEQPSDRSIAAKWARLRARLTARWTKRKELIRGVWRVHGWRVAVATLVWAVAVTASYLYGHPAELPGISLGWPFLLHLERGAAVLAAIGIVAIVGSRALKGELPLKFWQFEYAPKEAAEVSTRLVDQHERRLRELEARMPPDATSNG
jgi:hypothetical protein